MTETRDFSGRHFLPMVCSGHTDHSERQAKIEARYERAKARLAQGSNETLPFTVTDRNFLDCLLWSLLLDHRATVTGVPGDQWWGVEVEFYPTDDYKNPEKVFVECDSPTDGLVAIWEWLEERTEQK